MGNTPLSHGIFTWTLQIDKLDPNDSNRWKICVGIMDAPPTVNVSTFDPGSWAGGLYEAYGIELGQGWFVHGLVKPASTQMVAKSDKKKGLQQGDRITLSLDTTAGTLKCWWNEKRLHPACEVSLSFSKFAPFLTLSLSRLEPKIQLCLLFHCLRNTL